MRRNVSILRGSTLFCATRKELIPKVLISGFSLKYSLISFRIYNANFILAASSYTILILLSDMTGRYWMKVPFSSEGYEHYVALTLSAHVYSFASIGITYPLTDSPFLITGLHVVGFLDALKRIIRLLRDPDYSHSHSPILKNLLILHLEIIQKLSDFNSMMYIISFTQFLSSMILLAFMISLLLVSSQEYLMYFCALLAIVQLFLLCIFGEMFMIKTENITEELYQTNWYDLQNSDQKNLLFILKMSQRNYSIKAGGMYSINMYAFIQVI